MIKCYDYALNLSCYEVKYVLNIKNRRNSLTNQIIIKNCQTSLKIIKTVENGHCSKTVVFSQRLSKMVKNYQKSSKLVKNYQNYQWLLTTTKKKKNSTFSKMTIFNQNNDFQHFSTIFDIVGSFFYDYRTGYEILTKWF